MVERVSRLARGRDQVPSDERPEELARRLPDESPGGGQRFGRGVRWSDIVAQIEQDRLASEAMREEAA